MAHSRDVIMDATRNSVHLQPSGAVSSGADGGGPCLDDTPCARWIGTPVPMGQASAVGYKLTIGPILQQRELRVLG